MLFDLNLCYQPFPFPIFLELQNLDLLYEQRSRIKLPEKQIHRQIKPTENENVFRIDFEDSTVTQQWFGGYAQLRIRNVRYHALSDTLQYVDINNSTASNPTEFYQKLNDGEFEVDQAAAALYGDSFYFYKGSAYMVYELWKLARS